MFTEIIIQSAFCEDSGKLVTSCFRRPRVNANSVQNSAYTYKIKTLTYHCDANSVQNCANSY